MTRKLHVIYVPGIGDHNITGQQKAINTWKFWGVSAEICQMLWREGEWEPKFAQLLARIEAAHERGQKVALVGVSAGAGAVINAFAARKDVVSGVVLLAGKVNHPSGIGTNYSRRNPAFITSAYAAVPSLESLDTTYRRHIMSRYALVDPVVPKRDSQIPGARNRTVLSAGHATTIALQIIFGAPFFLHWLKRQANK